MSKKTSKPKAKKVGTEGGAPAKERDQRNGVTRPGAETRCGQIWAVLDGLKAEGKEITFDVLRAAVDSKTADATIRTQRQRWNRYCA